MELNWHKSSYSGNHGGDCVEVAETSRAVHMRDTQHRHLTTLTFTPEAFTTFVSDLKDEGSGRS
ncbi:DUF397 domain-containing protein [Nocardiopsis sp. HNM0947]|uniref:DUF397 domain-containing protein n=1 Tax=Nocardiopsis coralli TaxID=2772213 RepID=A0ABR9P4W3_9ACTN|nr:DUF397 domain-containing protein [Nocardiopsis coralli]MBE2998881.1 DUF397 domain-containing protein [Nocardiopsis coralli]